MAVAREVCDAARPVLDLASHETVEIIESLCPRCVPDGLREFRRTDDVEEHYGCVFRRIRIDVSADEVGVLVQLGIPIRLIEELPWHLD